jgi:hypothetical protein
MNTSTTTQTSPLHRTLLGKRLEAAITYWNLTIDMANDAEDEDAYMQASGWTGDDYDKAANTAAVAELFAAAYQAQQIVEKLIDQVQAFDDANG